MKLFVKIYKKNIFDGQFRTGHGISGYEMPGSEDEAKQLLKDLKQRSIVLSMPSKYYNILEKHFELKGSNTGNGILEIVFEYMEKNKLL